MQSGDCRVFAPETMLDVGNWGLLGERGKNEALQDLVHWAEE